MAQEKREAVKFIQRLPDDVSTADIVEALVFKQQVETGLRDLAEGRVLSRQELKDEIVKWRKSAGR